MGGGNMEAVYYGCGDKAPLPNGSLPSCVSAPGKGSPYVMADLERTYYLLRSIFNE
jgi:hypothetical protein